MGRSGYLSCAQAEGTHIVANALARVPHASKSRRCLFIAPPVRSPSALVESITTGRIARALSRFVCIISRHQVSTTGVGQSALAARISRAREVGRKGGREAAWTKGTVAPWDIRLLNDSGSPPGCRRQLAVGIGDEPSDPRTPQAWIYLAVIVGGLPSGKPMARRRAALRACYGRRWRRCYIRRAYKSQRRSQD
jgi:hypothetical protein